MTTLMQGAGRALALLLAGAALASCAAHGQGGKIDPKVYVNYTPYGEDFYRELMTGRVNLYAPRAGKWRNVVHGRIFASNGTLIECRPGRVDGKLFWIWIERGHWSLVKRRSGVLLERDFGDGEKRYWAKFYDPETGSFDSEYLKKGRWIRGVSGVIQDTWPRVLADGCRNLKPPAHIRINEKQTSQRLDELRRQDPDAPIRHFPGSHLTAPGRTGLGASRGRPTTTPEEVRRYIIAQVGNVVTSPLGAGYVFSGAGGGNELWQLADDGGIAQVGQVREEGDWLFIEVPGQPVLRYPVGYPVPSLPTGHRHAAFQLTDHLIGSAKPRSLPHMGAAYAGQRFVFHSEGKFSVVDLNGELVEGPHFDGVWRWTKGRLEMTVRDDPAGPRSIGWSELASDLDMQPTVWTRSTPDRIE